MTQTIDGERCAVFHVFMEDLPRLELAVDLMLLKDIGGHFLLMYLSVIAFSITGSTI